MNRILASAIFRLQNSGQEPSANATCSELCGGNVDNSGLHREHFLLTVIFSRTRRIHFAQPDLRTLALYGRDFSAANVVSPMSTMTGSATFSPPLAVAVFLRP